MESSRLARSRTEGDGGRRLGCGETAGAEGGRSNAVHVAGGHVVRRRHEGVVSASARWGSGPRSADENPFGEEQLGW